MGYLSIREIDNLVGAEPGCPVVVCVPCNPSRVALFSLVKLLSLYTGEGDFMLLWDSHS
jgi:hypothetical protein